MSTGDCWTSPQKQRHKREWVVPARRFTENVDYSHLPNVGKIRSDNDETMMLHYTLRGPGANQPPVGYFIVDTYKGLVHITRPLDREERQNYTLIGTAWYANKTIAEDNIKINIVVEDQNDNPPVFIKPEQSSVYEGSPVGTFVTQVVAKDADEPNTLHTKIAYSLIKQEPNDGKLFFAVDKDNGNISVNNPTLDREEHRSFVLTLQAADMYGSPEGNSATATVFIDILDVNDNIPTLEKDEFSASVDENEAPVEVLRIQALDNDEEKTDNWLAEFEIVSGNEDGLFSIETDPKTNRGVLYLNQPVDFESASDMNLNLVVANKALPGAPLESGAGAAGAGGASGAGAQHMFFGGSSSVPKQKTYLIKIGVKNKPEGPKFKPKIKPISVSENTKNSYPRVIDTYTAIEEDTGKTAEKVKYAKGYDPDSWISIDTDTAEIKLNKVPDRESPFVVNGTYYAKILCITDELHSQTSTGTIALQVEDLNDNCPKLLNNVQTVCSDTRVVNVTAEDEDSDPNGAPLEFRLIQEKTKGKWNLQQINNVSASLLAEDDLWPGFYEVTMEIRDKQGLVCLDEQVLHLEDVLLMAFPPKLYNEDLDEIKLSKEPLRMVEANFNIPAGEIQVPWSNQVVNNSSNMVGMMQKSAFGGFYYDMNMENSARWQEELDEFLKKYFAHKSRYISENDSPKQGLKQYDYESEGSVTGSIESCSFTESNDDLEFLNNLGSKFNTLAEVCGFRQTDPKVIVNTVEITPNAAASSSHVTNIVQPSPEEIPVKSPLVQPEPNQGTVIQEPMYYGFNQPMASNVLLSENGLGQGVYIINGTPEAGRILTQGNCHTLEHYGSGQQAVLANNIIGDSVLYSQIGPQSPVMVTKGLGEVNLPPTPNLVVMPQQQLDGIGSLQMLRENGQNRVTLIDGSINEGKVLVGGLGPSHRPMSPQLLYPVNSQELSGMVHMNQTVVDGSLSIAQNEGTVTIVESPDNGSNVLVGGPGTPNLVTVPQTATGQVNSQLLVSCPYPSASKKGGESRLLVSGHSILEAPVSGGNLLVAGPGQYPVSMIAGTPNLVRLPQVLTGQVNNSQLLVNGVQNIVSGKGGQSRQLVSGLTIVEGSSQLPLAMSPGVLSPAEHSQAANRQLFHSTVSRVLTSMSMMPKSKGFATNGQRNVEQ
uniref:Cadherin domain-containing protein n=1 Tax=Cyprinus carpio carpio TaxID=630221 RepID=A0A9J8AZA5_CYPCA